MKLCFKKAFTLVELLVVISIIALLLSILMPSLRLARNQAQSVVCKSYLKQIGFGTILFAEEHNGVVPTFAATETSMPSGAQLPVSYKVWYNWIGLLEPSITGKPLDEIGIYKQTSGYSEKIWWCPSDRVSRKNTEHPWWGGISYGINVSLYNRPGYPAYGPDETHKDGVKLYSLKSPSCRIYVSEHGKSLTLPDIPHFMYVPVVAPAGPSARTFEDYIVNSYFGAPGNYHPRISNSVFADCHVEAVDFEDMAYSGRASGGKIGQFWGWYDWPLVSRIPDL